MSESKKTALTVVLKSNEMSNIALDIFKKDLNKILESLDLSYRVPILAMSPTDDIQLHHLSQNGLNINLMVVRSDDFNKNQIKDIENSFNEQLPGFPIKILTIGRSDSLEFLELTQGE